MTSLPGTRVRAHGLLLTISAAAIAGCSASEGGAPAVAQRDADAGKLLLEQYDCGRCHVIPGVRRAEGAMGPTLEAFSRQAYIAGEVPSDSTRLAQWIQAPHRLVVDTLMPTQGVPAPHAAQMAAYLMTLR